MEKHEYSDFEKAIYYIDKKEYTKAIAYLRKEVEDDNPDAIFHLALMYWEGLGVESDFSEAKSLIYNAKQRQHPLGDMYWDIICAYE